jgi:hypothetical protein
MPFFKTLILLRKKPSAAVQANGPIIRAIVSLIENRDMSALLAVSRGLGNRAAVTRARASPHGPGLRRFNARSAIRGRGSIVSAAGVTTEMRARAPIAAPFAGRGGSPSSRVGRAGNFFWLGLPPMSRPPAALPSNWNNSILRGRPCSFLTNALRIYTKGVVLE